MMIASDWQDLIALYQEQMEQYGKSLHDAATPCSSTNSSKPKTHMKTFENESGFAST